MGGAPVSFQHSSTSHSRNTHFVDYLQLLLACCPNSPRVQLLARDIVTELPVGLRHPVDGLLFAGYSDPELIELAIDLELVD